MTTGREALGANVARRFRVLAIVATVGVVFAGASFAIAATILAAIRGADVGAFGGIALVLAVLVFLAAIGAASSARYGAAIRTLRARFPHGAVFLARRQPSVVNDLETWMNSKGITGEVSDGWMPALVDERGISAWTAGRNPTEVLLMEWSELGEIAMTRTAIPIGTPTWKVSVDVRPFVVPLTVEIGYSNALLTAALGAADTADVVRIVNAYRPGTSGE